MSYSINFLNDILSNFVIPFDSQFLIHKWKFNINVLNMVSFEIHTQQKKYLIVNKSQKGEGHFIIIIW